MSQEVISENIEWHLKHHGPHVVVTEDRPHVAQRQKAQQSTDGVRSSTGFTKGYNLIKFKFNNTPWGSHCSVGVCTRKASFHLPGYGHLFGQDKQSWAWDLPSGDLLNDGVSKPSGFSNVQEKTIYMIVDCENGQISFYGNGIKKFIAFSGISAGTKLFPCASLVYGMAEIRISLKDAEKNKKQPSNKRDSTLSNGDVINEVSQENKDSQVHKKNNIEHGTNVTTDRKESPNDEEYEPSHLKVSHQLSTEVVEKQEDNFEKLDETSALAENGEGQKLNGHDSQNMMKLNDHELNRTNNVASFEHTENLLNSSGHNDLSPAEEDPDLRLGWHDQTLPSGSQHQGNLESAGFQKNSGEKDEWQEKSAKDNDYFSTSSPFRQHEKRESPILRQHERRGSPVAMEEQVQQHNSVYQSPYANSLEEEKMAHEKKESEEVYKPTILETFSFMMQNEPAPAVYWPPDYLNVEMYAVDEDDQEAETEPSDISYTRIETLDPEDQYWIQMAHGWDMINRGGLVHLYPNVPQICVPLPLLKGKAQAIRGRKGFKEGRHKWCIRELKTHKATSAEVDDKCNKLLIGVASGDQRQFNFGFQILQMGRHMWMWDLETGNIWHPSPKHRKWPNDDDSKLNDVTAFDGIEMTLNLYKHSLTIEHQGNVIDIPSLRKDIYYPFVIFNQVGIRPVQIQYVEGPTDYVQNVLETLQAMQKIELEDFGNYRGLTRQMSSKTSLHFADTEVVDYGWGDKSSCLTCKGLLNNNILGVQHLPRSEDSAVALGTQPLQGGRYKIRFSSDRLSDWTIGMVSKSFEKRKIMETSTTGKLPQGFWLGSDEDSWCWSLNNQQIFHAGLFIGKYPSHNLSGFTLETYNSLLMTVDFASSGYHIASFTASQDKSTVDLGIAFVALPNSVIPAAEYVGPAANCKDASLKIEFVAGPKDFAEAPEQSQTCILL